MSSSKHNRATATEDTLTTTTADVVIHQCSSSSLSIARKEETDNNNKKHHTNNHVSADVTRRMVCGGVAGMIAKTATNPLERIKMLAQTGEHNSTSTSSKATTATSRQQPGIIALYRDIIRHEGILGLWAGNGVNLIRVFPAKAIVFSSNDVYKSLLLKLCNVDDNTHHHQSWSGPLSFLAGGLAGMTASLLTYPLDLARGRISGKLAGPSPSPAVVAVEATTTAAAASGATATASSPPTKSTKIYKGITQTIVLTVKDEGFLALYKGVTPTLLGAMPYEGIKFGTVGLLEWYFPKDSSSSSSDNAFLNHSHYPLRKMLFGGLGGVMAGLITYPNDTVRRLLQLQGSRSRTSSASTSVPTFTGYWDCVRYIYKTHGITRFYNGLTINLIRMAPNTAIQFGSYELLKKWTDDMFE